MRQPAGTKTTPRQSAEMDEQAAFARMAEEEIIGQRRQRHALAARRHVARTEVAHRRDAAALRDHGCHAQAQRGREAALGVVPDRVSGTADALHALQAQAGVIGHGAPGGRERLAEQTMQKADLTYLARSRSANAPDQCAQLLAVRLMQSLHLTHAQIQSRRLPTPSARRPRHRRWSRRPDR